MRRKKRLERGTLLYIAVILVAWLMLSLGQIETRVFRILLFGAFGCRTLWRAIEEYLEDHEFTFNVVISVIGTILFLGYAIYLLVQ